MSFKEKMSYFWSYAQKYHRVFNLLAIISLLVAVINALTPFLFGKMIDSVLTKTLVWGLSYWQIGLFWAVLGMFALALNLYHNSRAMIYMNYLSGDMIDKSCGHALSLPVNYHYDKKPGETYKIIDRGVDATSGLIELTYFNFAPHILPMLVAFVIMFSINWVIALIMLATVAIFMVVSVFYQMENILTNQKVINECYNQLYGHMGDFLANVTVVKTNTNEALELKRQQDKFAEIIVAMRRQRDYWNRLGLVQGLLINLSQVLVMIYATYLLYCGQLSAGLVAMFIGYFGRVYGPLNMIVNNIRMLRRELVNLEDAMSLSREKQEDESFEAKEHELRGKIEFRNVHFCYPERDEGVVNGLNFEILPGQTVAIFGKTGCGKTTLYNLLLGLFQPDVGEILFDGVNFSQIKKQSFRQQIAVVPQDRGLFNESIAYNISYGKPTATHEEMVVAAKVANIHDFIMSLPEGYGTKVGERGLRLSGGQVQRILIARAALRNPKILLLDEATSDLDMETKLTVLAALQNMIDQRTTIIISHEFSPLTKAADLILVLDKGNLMQKGKHQDLINQPGFYQDLWFQAKSIFD